MKQKKTTYICPFAGTCKAHKKCHVLTTGGELKEQISVWQKCVVAGKNDDGTTKEILITIGKIA